MRILKQTSDDKFERRYFDIYRKKIKWSIFGFILTEYELIYTGKLFGKVEINQQRTEYRSLQFDDGWSYSYYWSKWTEHWIFNKTGE